MFEGGHTVDLGREAIRPRASVPRTALRQRAEDEEREADRELHATLCATARQIRPAKPDPHAFASRTCEEPIRRAAFSQLRYDAVRKLDPRIRPPP